MQQNKIWGAIISLFGLGLLLGGFSFGNDGKIIALIYGMIILLVGVVIFFNKKEDSIEQIKSNNLKVRKSRKSRK